MHKKLFNATLSLRRLTPDDANWMTETVGRPDIYENVANIPPAQTYDQTLAFIANSKQGEEAGTDHTRIITLDEDPAGLIGLHRQSVKHAFELGYWLHPDFWNKGVMSTAGQMFLKWSDSFVSPRYYISGHFVDNPSSGIVLKRLGFMPSDRGVVMCKGRGTKVDHIYMSRFAE